jgi:hypothetical protein
VKVYGLGAPESRCHSAFSLRLELRRGCFDSIRSGLELREGESACVVRLQASLLAVFFAHDADIRAGMPEPVSSATSPEIALVVSPCAKTFCGAVRQTTKG